MEPNRFGRKLGIGVRVASRMVKERAAQANNAPASTPQPENRQPDKAPRPATPPPPSAPRKNLVEPARRVGEGTRRFGQAFLGPVKHVSATLWLEITGLFFALFALFFGQNAWNTRSSALHGPHHPQFLLYAVVTLIFLYFCVSSFVKAARRGRKRSR
ncbi:MAG TPA: hypothetical protein VGG80_00325 [Acidobacteriaceae bacterium]|jgi:hypothetical protein